MKERKKKNNLPWPWAVNKIVLLLSRFGMTKITSIICLILSKNTEIDREKNAIKATNSPTTPTKNQKGQIIH